MIKTPESPPPSQKRSFTFLHTMVSKTLNKPFTRGHTGTRLIIPWSSKTVDKPFIRLMKPRIAKAVDKPFIKLMKPRGAKTVDKPFTRANQLFSVPQTIWYC